MLFSILILMHVYIDIYIYIFVKLQKDISKYVHIVCKGNNNGIAKKWTCEIWFGLSKKQKEGMDPKDMIMHRFGNMIIKHGIDGWLPNNDHADGHCLFPFTERNKKIWNIHHPGLYVYPPVIKHGWLENPVWMEVLIGNSPINRPFSIAMFDYRRVIKIVDIRF